jgi:hypothetical protein
MSLFSVKHVYCLIATNLRRLFGELNDLLQHLCSVLFSAQPWPKDECIQFVDALAVINKIITWVNLK